MEWKSYFTDGLVQIAILLSIFRTDWNNYLNHSSLYHGYPEINEIIMGPLSVHTQSYIHAPEWHSSAIGLSHPKALSIDYTSSIFQDIHTLGRYQQRYDTNINAYLVNSHESPRHASENAQEQATPTATADVGTAASDPNNNLDTSSSDTSGSSVNTQTAPQVEASQRSEEENILSDLYSVQLPGTELTKEDMELIEILWRQDIDLGVERDAYDLKQRQLERQKESQLNQTLAKEKELAQKFAEEEQNRQNATGNLTYVVDRETGELVPAPADAQQSSESPVYTDLNDLENRLQQQQQHFHQQQQQLQRQQTQPPPQQPQIQELDTVSNLTLEQTVRMLVENVDDFHFTAENQTSDPAIQSGLQELEAMIDNSLEPLHTQSSIEHRWQDITNLLPLDAVTGDRMDLSEYGGMEGFDAAPGYNATATGAVYHAHNLLNNASLAPPQANANNFTEDFPVLSYQPPVDQAPTLGLNTSGLLGPSSAPNGGFVNSSDSLMQRLLRNDDSMDPSDLQANNTGTVVPMETNDTASDSAFSSAGGMSVTELSSVGSPTPDLSDFHSNTSSLSAYEALEGATGGDTESTGGYKYEPETPTPPPVYGDDTAQGYHGAWANTSANNTGYSQIPADTRKVSHNHTYPLAPGQEPRVHRSAKPTGGAVKEELDTQDLQYTRDEKRAKAMGVPFTMEEMITSPVDAFNELLEQHRLTDRQLQLIRDIRRRGKNKVAAQNCRKRKLEVIQTLEEEVAGMRAERDRLQRERASLGKDTANMRNKYSALYDQVFASLRDESGQPYDPSEYTLQQTDDGEMFLLPHNATSCIKEEPKSKGGRKRKDRKP